MFREKVKLYKKSTASTLKNQQVSFSRYLGYMLNHPKIGTKVRSYAFQFPQVALASSIQPITRNVLRVHLHVIPDFQWNDKMHGCVAEPWWIWVEDPETNTIYHSEYFLLTRKAVSFFDNLFGTSVVGLYLFTDSLIIVLRIAKVIHILHYFWSEVYHQPNPVFLGFKKRKDISLGY